MPKHRYPISKKASAGRPTAQTRRYTDKSQGMSHPQTAAVESRSLHLPIIVGVARVRA